MRPLLISILLFPLLALSQEKGIVFDKSASWKEVVAKAKAENKYIFVDCFTTWCAPCKSMDEFVFPDNEVAAYYNANFINVKVQFDSTGADNEYVRNWYEDRKFIDTAYKVGGYPTYLFFDPQGKLVHRFTGATGSKNFIATAKNSFDPETQYWTQLQKYFAGKKDPDFLRKLSTIAMMSNDRVIAKSAGNEYIATHAELYTKDNLEFLISLTQSSKDKGFAIFVNNPEKVNAVLGKGKAESLIKNIAWNEDVFHLILRSVRIVDGKPVFEEKGSIDWQALSVNLQSKYPSLAEELIAKARIFYYKDREKWAAFCESITPYMAKYSDNQDAETLNEYAGAIFRNCKDAECISKAAEWSRQSLNQEENPSYINTYANLLYKLGKTKEAIEWQTKAIALHPDEDYKSYYRQNLAKMERGEKTWKE